MTSDWKRFGGKPKTETYLQCSLNQKEVQPFTLLFSLILFINWKKTAYDSQIRLTYVEPQILNTFSGSDPFAQYVAPFLIYKLGCFGFQVKVSSTPTSLNNKRRWGGLWQFDIEVDNLTVSSGFQLHLYVRFLLCHFLGHLHPKTAFLFGYEITVVVTSLTRTNRKIQHKRKYSMIYDTVLDIVLISYTQYIIHTTDSE